MSQLSVYTGPTSNSDNQLRIQQAQRSPAYDAVDKIRVSTPQSLIDTDFEYGQQATKWEQVSTQNNRQSAYYIIDAPLPVTAITGNQTNTYQLVITTGSNVTVATGTPIFIEDALDPNAKGWGYVVTGVSAGTSFTVQMSTATTTVTCWSATATYVYQGYFYSNCGINLGTTTAVTNVGTTITVTTAYPHGLLANAYIYMVGLTASTNAPNGAFVVATVPTSTTFTFSAVAVGAPTGTINNTVGQTNLYARPAGWVDAHAYDGSINFTAGAAVPAQTLVRQTRRYFRYQSGKGIQFATGTAMKPQIQLPVLTASGGTITVTTKCPHNMTVGTSVNVNGFDQTAYNGTFVILTVPTALTFTYQTVNNITPSALTATSTVPNIGHVSPAAWYGSSNKIGFFDNQNGMFFQYDGQTLYAVYRTSVNQITGTVSVTQGSGTVTGTNTAFATQLIVGDFIVIRGQSYRVLSITSNTILYISPEYRGTTIANALVSRTIDTKIPQSSWYDVLDGSSSASNPSGYNLDLTKIQMFFIDYAWYGAGVIRWGIRTTGGAIANVYTLQSNNVQYSAYLRSGNLCGHYEQNNVAAITTITSNVLAGDTTINVASTAGFNPAGGTAKITASGIGGAVEYVSYTSLTSTTLNGLTRGATGGGAASGFTYSATSPVSIEYASPDTAALLSHWGCSILMDGGYNQDVSAIYNYGMTAPLTTAANTNAVPIMALRVAPSVDNGTVGLMGVKEIINRLQLQFREIAVVTNTTFLIQLILNGIPSAAFSSAFVTPVQGGTNTSSIAQIAVNTTNTVTITGGESIAAFYSNSAGQTTYDLSTIAAVGNAALGGGNSNTVPTTQAGFFPDGPDIVYVVATPLSATGSFTCVARLNWQESQA